MYLRSARTDQLIVAPRRGKEAGMEPVGEARGKTPDKSLEADPHDSPPGRQSATWAQPSVEQKESLVAHVASEYSYRDIIELAPDALLAVDSQGRIALVNQQTEVMFGYARGELLGQPIETLIPERSRTPHRKLRAGYMEEPHTRPMGVDLPLFGRRRDGSEFPVEIGLSPLNAGTEFAVVAIVRDSTERRRIVAERTRELDHANRELDHANRELDHANKELRRLSHRILETQESERRLIARELHDEIGQQLTGVKMLLDTLEESIQDGSGSSNPKGADVALDKPLFAPSLSEISAAVATTLERVRDLSLDLRPAVLDSMGLLPALQWQFERYTRLTGMRVDFSADGLDHRLPTRVEAGVYRLIQEALTNVSRHAGAAEVTVQIYVTEETLSLYVVDAGVGFDVEEALAAGGSTGLAGMRERADLLGGTLAIDSLLGEGTTIHADFSITRVFEMDAAHETDEDFAYEGWQTPPDDAARHRARDELRDRARDKYRDAARDARRDTQRDILRDMTRDAARDAAIMHDQQLVRREEEP
jgi:PAS domain S-box-containing protein